MVDIFDCKTDYDDDGDDNTCFLDYFECVTRVVAYGRLLARIRDEIYDSLYNLFCFTVRVLSLYIEIGV